jgi:predicted O-methyltransferase YrrM
MSRARELLNDVIASGQVQTPCGQCMPLHSELPAEEGAVLQHWLREACARKVLEVGCAYGISSLYICEALEDMESEHYHVIDAFQDSQWHGIGRAHLEMAAPGAAITFHEVLSELCLPRLLEQGLSFDFAYVDGWHTFDQVMLEFYYINRMLDVGGVIVFDDIHLPSQQKVLAFIETCPAYTSLALPDTVRNSLRAKVRRAAGVPPIRLHAFQKTSDDARDWDWHEEF